LHHTKEKTGRKVLERIESKQEKEKRIGCKEKDSSLDLPHGRGGEKILETKGKRRKRGRGGKSQEGEEEKFRKGKIN